MDSITARSMSCITTLTLGGGGGGVLALYIDDTVSQKSVSMLTLGLKEALSISIVAFCSKYISFRKTWISGIECL